MRKPPPFPALVVAILLGFAAGARAQGGAAPSLDQTLCTIIDTSAAANGLPTDFFSRLIWRESAMRPGSVSPAGAEGVAQFMPRTAAERGLADPFDPATAIPEAARLLAELAARFGNLGLAAAAYNAGPDRTARWLAGRADLPLETRAYVYAITSRTAQDWAKSAPTTPAPAKTAPGGETCPQVIAALRRAAPGDVIGRTPFAPWGVQLAGNFSKSLALASFERVRRRHQGVIGADEPFILASRLRYRGARLFYRVRLPAATRASAQRLCDRLHSAGASCIVLRS